ncbi:MAG TPA: ATP synthase F0 subunit B [Bryobacteraceae bacterium]|nr:ATP synthase F0 subunit B [Bryobacteraceae bacterium]
MEQTIQALGGLMQKAIPTIILLIIVFWYFRAMLFAPLARVLKQREELTEGARKAAEKSLALAEDKQKEYEQKFDDARAGVYRLQEETRRKWLEEHAAHVAEARARSEQIVREATERISAEADQARAGLTGLSAELAGEIVSAILERRAGSAG